MTLLPAQKRLASEAREEAAAQRKQLERLGRELADSQGVARRLEARLRRAAGERVATGAVPLVRVGPLLEERAALQSKCEELEQRLAAAEAACGGESSASGSATGDAQQEAAGQPAGPPPPAAALAQLRMERDRAVAAQQAQQRHVLEVLRQLEGSQDWRAVLAGADPQRHLASLRSAAGQHSAPAGGAPDGPQAAGGACTARTVTLAAHIKASQEFYAWGHTLVIPLRARHINGAHTQPVLAQQLYLCTCPPCR